MSADVISILALAAIFAVAIGMSLNISLARALPSLRSSSAPGSASGAQTLASPVDPA